MRARRVIAAALILALICQPHDVRVPGHAAPVPCVQEDGSTPGQAFPCVWDATTRGNGIGTSYVLTDAS